MPLVFVKFDHRREQTVVYFSRLIKLVKMSEPIEYKKEDEMRNVEMFRPHVVILGAGASAAAFPSGDKEGKVLPLMADLLDVLELREPLKEAGVNIVTSDFEGIYASLFEDPTKKEIVSLMDERIESYFKSLTLPDEATIYDYLVLSLREKDIIATFNWDPLLYQACARNAKFLNNKLPHVVYLHGNTAIKYCLKCKSKIGYADTCKYCGEDLEKARLLYPIRKKNYNESPFIRTEWNTLKTYMKNAYILTIFGYRAPESDVEAIELLKEGWGKSAEKDMEEVEMIHRPGRAEETVTEPWKNLIFSHHYRLADDFFKSWMGKHPRRTCEAMWQELMESQFLGENALPRVKSLSELQESILPFLGPESK